MKKRIALTPDAEKVRHARAHLEAIVEDAAAIPMSVLRPRITRLEVRCIDTVLQELHRLNVAIALQSNLLAQERQARATGRAARQQLATPARTAAATPAKGAGAAAGRARERKNP